MSKSLLDDWGAGLSFYLVIISEACHSLFIDFAKWVSILKPKIFVMENVKGILSRKSASKEKVVEIITNTFNKHGYSVEIWILNAAEYGIPQFRERVFFVGNRLGKKIPPPPKTHSLNSLSAKKIRYSLNTDCELLPSITVEDAISDLAFLEAGNGSEIQAYQIAPKTPYQKWARGNLTKLYNHVAMRHTSSMVERFRLIRSGHSIMEMPAEYRAKKRNGNGEISEVPYHSNNRRLDANTPSFTIPAHFYSSFVHPHQNRNLTAREAARLQSFPDSYRFMGKRTIISRKLLEKYGRHEDNYLSQYNQIGNAVPPLLAKAIAEHLRPYLKKD
jgi:DNA (cytosine-5)-methyltransferase 1